MALMTATEDPGAPDGDNRPRQLLQAVVGVLAVVIGLPVAGSLFLSSLLSSNACGAFGDGCDDYGETGAGFEWFASGGMIALFVAVGGLAVVIWSVVKGYRRRPR